MTKKMKIIIGITTAIVIIGGVIIIAPNYKNEIADDSTIVVDTNDTKIYSEVNTLRIEKNIDTYTKEAEAIVIGKFTRKGDAVWNSDKTEINTETFFKVEDVLKGVIKPGEEIKILQWGGDLDGRVQTFEGAIEYNTGQSNFLFLGTNEDGEWVVFSGDWGQFIVNDNENVKDFDDKIVSPSDFKSEISKRIE